MCARRLVRRERGMARFMFCPVCHCEYVSSVKVCADCHVDLVPELASEAPEGTGDAGVHWVGIWSGGDPRRHEDLCAILEDEQIPVRTALEGGLLNISSYSAYDIYVPADCVAQATEVLRQLALSEREWEQSANAEDVEFAGDDESGAESVGEGE